MHDNDGKKKNQPSSKFKSFYLSFRRHLPCSRSSSPHTSLPIEPIPIPHSRKPKRSSSNHLPVLGDRRKEATELHWRRVNELERELAQIEEWLHTELARLRRHLRTDDGGNHEIRTANDNVYFEGARGKIEKLDGAGGYLYCLHDNKGLNYCGSCQDLAIQFSSPALVQPEDGSSISEVLNQMAAMGRENLMNWLLGSIPMTDIAAHKPQGRRTITPCSIPEGFEEAILLNAIPKLGELVVKGLRIQMGVKEVVKRQKQEIQEGRRQNTSEGRTDDDHGGECGGGLMRAMLIQPRDPNKGYEPVSEMMIGFIEAADGEDEQDEFIIKAVHVAGLKARRRDGQVIHNCLWSLSLPN